MLGYRLEITDPLDVKLCKVALCIYKVAIDAALINPI